MNTLITQLMNKSLAFKAGVVTVAAIVLLCALYGVAFFTNKLPEAFIFWPHSIHNVVLTQSGFHPSKLTIREGDTIVFSTTLDEPFWPASNPHPVHTEYPVFDPRKPIDHDKTWSFTFPTAGDYGFHDHMRAQFLGEVVVLRKDGTQVTTDCTTLKSVQCYEKLMHDTVKNKGIAAGLDLIAQLSQTEPGFGADCHGYVHIIGEEAYYKYAANDNFELTPATAMCGYGFYHGFMETLLHTTGDIEQARDFCKLVSQKLAGKAGDAGTACYHGTGHGAMDGSDPTAWGDPDKMMAPALKLCGMLAENSFQMYLCATGAFNALEILSHDPKYGLSDLLHDPFAFCNKQPIERREGCYSNMFPIILDNANNDFQKAQDYINSHMIDNEVTAIDGHTINQLVTIGLMFEWMRVHEEEPDYAQKGITFCRAQPADDHLACIEGLSGGHIKYGKPGEEYVKNLEFCANSMLTSEERNSCYSYTLPRLSGRYDRPTTKMICAQVPQEYRDRYCPKF